LSNAGGGIERLLRPVQLLLALHLTTAKAPLLGCDGGISYTVGGLKDGGSTMTMEQRMDRLEKRNKRLTVALTMAVVAMAAVVTMAATGDQDQEEGEQ
jgi:hypothetical protein